MTRVVIGDMDLARVVGGGRIWNGVDKGVAAVYPAWKDKGCPSRASYVGWTIGTVLGAASWATWSRFGPKGQAVLGPINGLIGTGLVSNYMDNCDKQKKG